jgi:hypothetical protein
MAASRIVDSSYSYLDSGKYSISLFLYYSPTAISTFSVLAGVGSREIVFDNRSTYRHIIINFRDPNKTLVIYNSIMQYRKQ